MSLFSTPSPPSEAGGTGPAGGKPDFPSPTKLERNGLTGAELGAQTNQQIIVEQQDTTHYVTCMTRGVHTVDTKCYNVP